MQLPSFRIDVDRASTPEAFLVMVGNDYRFTHLECDPFTFPRIIKRSDTQIKNERQFIEFLIRNDWVQRMIGIKMYSNNGFFPDIRGEIYDGSEEKIRVEVEYYAESYIKHKHSFRGCDLILSFIKHPDTITLRGIPVWSFYEGCIKDKHLNLCLMDTIKFNFLSYNPKDWYE